MAWYRNRDASPPFFLSRKLKIPLDDSIGSLAFFPWTKEALLKFWRPPASDADDINVEAEYSRFAATCEDIDIEFRDAIAIGGRFTLCLCFTKSGKRPILIKLPEHKNYRGTTGADCVQVAWAIRQDTYAPIILFSHLSLLYLFDVKKNEIVNCLRGHGGSITSIAVHPKAPYLFATTSRDFSVRLYNLTEKPQKNDPCNPPWPTGQVPCRAGPAHGLQMSEIEGMGKIGRCVMVLLGGWSGGHQAEVLCAAFHPDLPLLATGGVSLPEFKFDCITRFGKMDRAVKIWYLFPPMLQTSVLDREDKPLFSSTMIHNARVTSISWLQSDLLLSHSAPAIMSSTDANQKNKHTCEPGSLVMWRWLALERFLPAAFAGRGNYQRVLRGCASDYVESASFKIVSQSFFPPQESQFCAARVQVFQANNQDPLILFTHPHCDAVTMVNAIHLQPRTSIPSEPDDEVEHLRTQIKNLDLNSNDSSSLPGWKLRVRDDGHVETLEFCAMGDEGFTIAATSSDNTIWVWTLQ